MISPIKLTHAAAGRSVIVAMILSLALAASAPSHSAQEKNNQSEKVPRFSDYPVKDIYRGKPAAVNLTSHPLARTFRTVLREGAEKGPNFAGHFTVVLWGCGAGCQSFAIVEANSGKVMFMTSEKEKILEAVVGLDYKLDSSLLIVNPIAALEAEDPASNLRSEDCRYYVWRGTKLELVFVQSPKRPVPGK
jgi:hypothetical protein